MARFEFDQSSYADLGIASQADRLFDLGLASATGRQGEIDMVAAHKWFNIAAAKGSSEAAVRRSEIAETLSKAELAEALRAAREWMTLH